jgi:glutathione S-transferase
MKLYHCAGARSLRALWTLEELGLDYELEVMPFPPRTRRAGYLDINPLGTVPTFVDGALTMTESSGICHYLVETHAPTPLRLAPDESGYGEYLNWLYRSDATLTFPQTIVLRYSRLEPQERRLPQAVDDYSAWFLSRLRSVETLRPAPGRQPGPRRPLQAQLRPLPRRPRRAPRLPARAGEGTVVSGDERWGA